MIYDKLLFAFMLLFYLILYTNCTNDTIRIHKGVMSQDSENESDTLFYNDTLLIGKQLYPLNTGMDNGILSDKDSLLSAFEIDSSSYLLLYNPELKLDFLDDLYSRHIVKQCIKRYYSNNKRRPKKVVYTDGGPFLTGFYSQYDSVILASYILNLYLEDKIDNFRKGDIDYVCFTEKSNNKIYPYFDINVSISEVISQLNLPFNFKPKSKNIRIILTDYVSELEINQITFRKLKYNNSNNIIILSFKDNSLVKIQMVDYTYISYILFYRYFNTYYILNP